MKIETVQTVDCKNSRLLAPGAPRCHAKTRRGTLCKSPAVKGKARCRMHGGKSISQRGERNGRYVHGCATREAIGLRRATSRLLKALKGSAHP